MSYSVRFYDIGFFSDYYLGVGNSFDLHFVGRNYINKYSTT